MASVITKKPCLKCDKGAGVTTCDGCQQTFCIKHIIEHRQELTGQLDNVGHEHDLFRQDLMHETSAHPLLVRIDEWERESITKIQVTAETARADLRLLLEQNKTQLKESMDKITKEMQAGRELDDFTEIDLLRWTEELKHLRELLDAELHVRLIEDPSRSTSVPMIKISEEQGLNSSILHRYDIADYNRDGVARVKEMFRNFAGKLALSEGGYVATCIGSYWDGSTVYGTRLYSSGRHEIRFRIDHKGSNDLFFGIKTTSDDLPVRTWTGTCSYGWWEVDQAIESVNGHRVHTDRGVRTGDEITLVLDCENRLIQFEHHRVNTIAQMLVDLRKCPFPWQILVTLRSNGDCVRIIQ
ncbi:unnamed protein product [Adineta ricciae]|uniref:B30.2/SPRY domain-containing protein n=1 Tax=Adineta ricciae TaxID=249248 RepID=A0A814P722_ADIRI|nr:unnamed protein product [Adineta ricciae]